MTSTPPSRPPTEHTLLGTTDASTWASEFCRIFQGKTIGGPIVKGEVDEGGMLAWFANALETGRNIGRKELCPHDNVSELSDDLSACLDCGFLLQGAEEAEQVDEEPYDQDDDEPDDEPTLEEKFKEGFDEGRV